MNEKRILKNIIKKIKKSKKILLTSHVHPDGDAIGSCLALYEALCSMGKQVVVVNQSLDPLYSFLKLYPKIQDKIEYAEDYDLAIALDAPTLERLGLPCEEIKKIKCIINIDHHVSNSNYADINYVDAQMSSIGEILFSLFDIMRIKITPSIAENLFVSITTDTGFFRYANTKPATLDVASKLLAMGIDLDHIVSKLYYQFPLRSYKLLSRALSTLHVDEQTGLGYMQVPYETYQEMQCDYSDSNEFVEHVRSLKDVKVAMIFKEYEKNKIKISLRSKGSFDVNQFANKFGGGGHKQAAGFSFEGSMDECVDTVIESLSRES